MARNVCRALIAGLAVLAAAGTLAAATRVDRLDRFRELAASRLALGRILEDESPADAYREIWALLDDEIVENLASGGPFASLEFLQDRLDTFGDAWGGASLRLVRASGLLIGAFVLNDRNAINSLRVYGGLAGSEPALLRAFYRPGRPSVHVLPGLRDAAPFVVAWEGAPAGWGTRPLQIEVLRREGDGVRVTWSTATLFNEGLFARTWSVRGADVRVRYEVRYPGWAPGCEGQTEQEDVYRVAPTGHAARVARHQHDPWHRDLHAVVERLVEALAVRDEAALTALVPDRTLRSRLPASLRPEPTCDAREGETVSVAAVAARQPWTLSFRRAGPRWRLTGAAPVLQ